MPTSDNDITTFTVTGSAPEVADDVAQRLTAAGYEHCEPGSGADLVVVAEAYLDDPDPNAVAAALTSQAAQVVEAAPKAGGRVVLTGPRADIANDGLAAWFRAGSEHLAVTLDLAEVAIAMPTAGTVADHLVAAAQGDLAAADLYFTQPLPSHPAETTQEVSEPASIETGEPAGEDTATTSDVDNDHNVPDAVADEGWFVVGGPDVHDAGPADTSVDGTGTGDVASTPWPDAESADLSPHQAGETDPDDPHREERASYASELSVVITEVGKRRNQLSTLAGQATEVAHELEQSLADLTSARDELDRVEEEITATLERRDAVEADLAQAEKTIAAASVAAERIADLEEMIAEKTEAAGLVNERHARMVAALNDLEGQHSSLRADVARLQDSTTEYTAAASASRAQAAAAEQERLALQSEMMSVLDRLMVAQAQLAETQAAANQIMAEAETRAATARAEMARTHSERLHAATAEAADMLAEAQREARNVTATASERAEDIIAEATSKAADLVSDARFDAAEIVNDAKTKADVTAADAARMSEFVVTLARAEAQSITAAAETSAAEMVAMADQRLADASSTKALAEATADAMRRAAQVEADRLLADAVVATTSTPPPPAELTEGVAPPPLVAINASVDSDEAEDAGNYSIGDAEAVVDDPEGTSAAEVWEAPGKEELEDYYSDRPADEDGAATEQPNIEETGTEQPVEEDAGSKVEELTETQNDFNDTSAGTTDSADQRPAAEDSAGASEDPTEEPDLGLAGTDTAEELPLPEYFLEPDGDADDMLDQLSTSKDSANWQEFWGESAQQKKSWWKR